MRGDAGKPWSRCQPLTSPHSPSPGIRSNDDDDDDDNDDDDDGGTC